MWRKIGAVVTFHKIHNFVAMQEVTVKEGCVGNICSGNTILEVMKKCERIEHPQWICNIFFVKCLHSPYF